MHGRDTKELSPVDGSRRALTRSFSPQAIQEDNDLRSSELPQLCEAYDEEANHSYDECSLQQNPQWGVLPCPPATIQLPEMDTNNVRT